MADDGFDILDSELRRKAAKSNARYDQVTIYTTPHQRRLLFAAAQFRDMAMQSYARRAIVAFAAHDLQIPWSYVMADEPPVTTFTEFGTMHRTKGVAGAGFGAWIIDELHEWRPEDEPS
jgi:hypothetical protein